MATVFLRSLTEPAYVLLGGLLPADESGEVKILRSPSEVVAYPHAPRPIFDYLSRLHLRSDAVASIAAWDGDAADLDLLAEQGLLVRFPAWDEHAVRVILAPLTVRIPGRASATPDGSAGLLHLPGGRAVVIRPATVAVLDCPVVRSLGDGVTAVATDTGLDRCTIWQVLVDDLSDVLAYGAGHLALTPSGLADIGHPSPPRPIAAGGGGA